MRNKIFGILGITFLLITAFSCNNIIDKEITQSSFGKATVYFNVGHSESRTIFAPNLTLDKMTYTLKGAKLGETAQTFVDDVSYSDFVDKTSILVELGVWSFTLEARKYDSKKIFYISKLPDVEIVAGKNTLSFELTDDPTELNSNVSSYGDFRIKINFPYDARVEKVQAALFDANFNIKYDYQTLTTDYNSVAFVTANLGKYISNLAGGDYIVSFKFFDANDDEIMPGYSELIQIRDERTTTAEITLDELGSYHLLKWNLNGGTIVNGTLPGAFSKNESVILPTENDIEKPGFVFGGWYTNNNFNGDAITEIPSGTKNNVTLWARWLPTSFTVEDALITLSNWLASLEGSGPFSIKITGGITNEQLSKISNIIITNSKKKIEFDLSETTGLTEIPDNIFSACSNLTNIVIPNGVTSIGESAFYNCSSLASITIPYAVETIGNSAFYGCSALTIVNCAGISYWRGITFENTSSNPLSNSSARLYVEGVNVTDDIDRYNIYYYGLNDASNPNPSSYKSSVGLTLVAPSSSNLIFNRWEKDGKKITSIPIGTTGDITLTATWKEGVKIAASAVSTTLSKWLSNQSEIGPFYVYITGELTADYINDIATALKENSTKYVELDLSGTRGLVTLPSSAFKDCSKLESIVIPSGVETIGSQAFYGCSALTDVTIPSSVTEIGYAAFYDCSSLTNVYVASIASWCGIVFNGNYAYGAYYSNPLYYAKHFYVNGNEVKNLVIPSFVNTFSTYAFYEYDYIESVSISGSVTTIPNDAFYGCKGINKVTINSGVTKIGSQVFYGCSALTDITIPGSVSEIGYAAFYECSSLTNVYVASIANWCGIAFNGNYAYGAYCSNPLYYAKHFYVNGSEAKYLVIPSEVKDINSYAFYNCKSLISVTIPSRTTYIGSDAFYNCTNLTSVKFAETTGWATYSSSSATAGTIIDVTDPETNATNLTSSTWGGKYLRNK